MNKLPNLSLLFNLQETHKWLNVKVYKGNSYPLVFIATFAPKVPQKDS